MKLHKKTRQSGFTLIELLAVVAILGILAGIAVPRIFGAIQGARLGVDRSNIMMIQSAVEQWAVLNNPGSIIGVNTTTPPTGWNALVEGVVAPGALGPHLITWTVLTDTFLDQIPVCPITGATDGSHYRITFETVGSPPRYNARVVRNP